MRHTGNRIVGSNPTLSASAPLASVQNIGQRSPCGAIISAFGIQLSQLHRPNRLAGVPAFV
jgi:hypothetical protein